VSLPVTDLILRAARTADIPALSALGQDSFVDKFGYMYRDEDLAAFLEDTHSQATVAAELAHPERRYRLAEIDGALAGYCKLGIPSTLAAHVANTPHAASRPIEIKQLYTAPGMTGKGIGARLMDWAMAEARAYGADAIQLSVYSGNADAQRFYARYGFSKVADITFVVGEQIDEEFLFALKL
jgi:ribosomal protein S18 acetylase RimI-like enzyme